jgi:hypothetical protein
VPIAVRNNQAATTSSTVTATYTESTPLDASHGHIAFVRRLSSDAPTSVSSGWSLVTSRTQGTVVGLWVYRARGNGTINGITVNGTSVSTVIQIAAYAGVYDDDFAKPFEGNNAHNVITLPVSPLTSTEAGQVATAYFALSSTAGGTGFALDNGYDRLNGGSSSSTVCWGEKQLGATGDSGAVTATWTTSRPATGVAVLLRVAQPASAVTIAAASTLPALTQSGTLSRTVPTFGVAAS